MLNNQPQKHVCVCVYRCVCVPYQLRTNNNSNENLIQNTFSNRVLCEQKKFNNLQFLVYIHIFVEKKVIG